MGRRKSPEVSAGSMADIAFLLLVFFLVTSEMTKEEGMMQMLPELSDETITEPVKERNAIRISMNESDQILFEDQQGLVFSDLRALLKIQILNADGNPNMPESRLVTREELEASLERAKKKYAESTETNYRFRAKEVKKAELRLKTLDTFGDAYRKSNHVISVYATQGTKYNSEIQLKNVIDLAYRELRSELAERRLGRSWDNLTQEEKSMLKMVFKKNVSIAPVLRN